jgi:hypothetical protein
MVLNSNDEPGTHQAIDRLPPLHRRLFRLHVQFRLGWHKDQRDIWSVATPRRQAIDIASPQETFAQRHIRGVVRQVDHIVEAQPPTKLICPACQLLQVIPRRYRRGVPPAVGPQTS